MSDWGDEFERRHFDGDFLGTLNTAVDRAVDQVGERASRAVDRVGAFADQFIEPAMLTDRQPDAWHLGHTAHGLSPAEASLWRQDAAAGLSDTAVQHGAAKRNGTLDESVDLWLLVKQLQTDLERERQRRKELAASICLIDERLGCLQQQVSSERQLAAEAESACEALGQELDSSDAQITQWEACQSKLILRKAVAEAELQRHARTLAASSPQDDGPETQALKSAKVELAEICGRLDEARLQSRRELAALQRDIEQASHELQRSREGPAPAERGSIRSSLRRFLTVAAGSSDAEPQPASTTILDRVEF